MFEKNLRMAYLLDFYGDVLDEHTRSVMEAYYDDDLSLGEIALGEGISRQGIRHTVKKGEEQLTFLEERLSLAAQHELLCDYAKRLTVLEDKLKKLGEDEDAMLVGELIKKITDKGN